MVSSIFKNRFYLIVLSSIGMLLLIGSAGSLAIAATGHATRAVSIGIARHRTNAEAHLAGRPAGPPPPPPGNNQVNNQAFHGGGGANDNVTNVIGANEGNTGNQGINRGYSQDNAINHGNQVSGQRRAIAVQQNNQYLRQGDGGGGGNGNTTTFMGSNQANSGNEGLNFGHNQDNANNSGNQVNNEGNVIGTQINKQGTTVNNRGNVIQNQINYVNLLPGLGVTLTLQPKIQVGLSVGN